MWFFNFNLELGIREFENSRMIWVNGVLLVKPQLLVFGYVSGRCADVLTGKNHRKQFCKSTKRSVEREEIKYQLLYIYRDRRRPSMRYVYINSDKLFPYSSHNLSAHSILCRTDSQYQLLCLWALTIAPAIALLVREYPIKIP